MSVLAKLHRRILLAIIVGALIYLGMSVYVDLDQMFDAFTSFDWRYLPLIFLMSFLNYSIRFFKWDFYLRQIDVHLSRADSLRIYFSGYIMTVSPGRVGEVLKSYLLKKIHGTPISRSAPIVIAERYTDFIGMVVLAFIGVNAYRFGDESFRWKMMIMSFVLICVFLVLTGYRPLAKRVIRLAERLPLFSRFAMKIETAFDSIQTLVAPKSLLYGTVNSVVSWFCECIGFYLVLRGFGLTDNPSVNVMSTIFIYAFSTIIGAISMLPGGLGVVEGGLTGLLTVIKVPKNLAVAVTLIIRMATMWFAVLIGIVVLSLNQNRFEGVEEYLDGKAEEEEL
ncbi:YbhN family protein [Thermodesulfobacteriota bacterium]